MTAALFAKDLLANTNNPFKKAKTTSISMTGDLDDDLFIIKSTPNANTMTHCFQMHNPKSNFNYHGVNVKSENIYGIIDFKDSFQLEKNENQSIVREKMSVNITILFIQYKLINNFIINTMMIIKS